MSDYPDSLDVRPLTTWPGELSKSRQRSPFRAPLRTTLATLTNELQHLRARTPVLEVAIPKGDDYWRIDGRPRARAWAEHPGVVLSLPHTAVGPLRYATDTFDEWADNLRAIALGLEALRKVDRYGITKRGEQYAGFKAIGSGIAMPGSSVPSMTVEEAARTLAEWSGQGVLASYKDLLPGLGGGGSRRGEYLAAAWRSAVKLHHPDRGGDRAIWDRLEQAKRVLDEYAGPSR